MDLTAQDAANLLKIIDRVDFKGAEATPVAILQQKLTALANTASAPAVETPDLDQPKEAPAEVVKELKGEKK